MLGIRYRAILLANNVAISVYHVSSETSSRDHLLQIASNLDYTINKSGHCEEEGCHGEAATSCPPTILASFVTTGDETFRTHFIQRQCHGFTN